MKVQSILSIAALALSNLADAAGSVAPAPDTPPTVVMENGLGPYPVAIYQHEIKTSRPDILAPQKENRRLMVTVYRPFLDNFTCSNEQQKQIQYIQPVVAGALLQTLAPTGGSFGGMASAGAADASSPSARNLSTIFNSVKLTSCSRAVPASSSASPILLFSPGFLGTHHIYAATVQAAASSGYTVVAIDHTYESAAVVFPDGFVAYTSNATLKYNEDPTKGQDLLQAVRTNDSVSVLDAIQRGEVPGVTCGSKPLRAVMYGHSFGGSTAVNAAAADSRIVGAANIDGPHHGPVVNGTFRKPVLMMQSSALPPMAANFPDFYAHHARGWKTWALLNNTEHYGYTDLPQLADLLNARGSLLPVELTGAINSRRLQEIVWRYTTQFFAYVMKGASSDLLLEKSTEFPDIQFKGHSDA